jgi:hypothetical protein
MSDSNGQEGSLIELIDHELGERLERIAAIYEVPLATFANADDAESRTIAAPLLAPNPIIQRIRLEIDDLEGWLVSFYNTAVRETAEEVGAKPERFLWAHARGWLRGEVATALEAFGSAQGHVHDWAERRAEYSREHTIGRGVLKGFEDALSWLGGPKAMARRASDAIGSLTSADDLEARFQKVSAEFENAAALLHESLYRTVWAELKHGLVPLLQRISGTDKV